MRNILESEPGTRFTGKEIKEWISSYNQFYWGTSASLLLWEISRNLKDDRLYVFCIKGCTTKILRSKNYKALLSCLREKQIKLKGD